MHEAPRILQKTDQSVVAEMLSRGAVGVLPTDTVYGLVARAADKPAVIRLYALKRRERKPGTVIAANVEQLQKLGVDSSALQKVRHWWPNPLSIVLPFGSSLRYLDQGVGSGAVRVVADAWLHDLLLRTGPLLTSSANQPGEPGSVNLKQAQRYFADNVDFYLDGGDLAGRTPSTIIRLRADGSIELLREGPLKPAQPETS